MLSKDDSAFKMMSLFIGKNSIVRSYCGLSQIKRIGCKSFDLSHTNVYSNISSNKNLFNLRHTGFYRRQGSQNQIMKFNQYSFLASYPFGNLDSKFNYHSFADKRVFSSIAQTFFSSLFNKNGFISEKKRKLTHQYNFDNDSNNAENFASTMRRLNHSNPIDAIRLYEGCSNSNIRNSESVIKEYLKALVITNRLHDVNIMQILRSKMSNPYNSEFQHSNFPSHQNFTESPRLHDSEYSSKENDKGIKFRLDTSKPLKIVVMESQRSILYRLLRSLIGLLIVVSALSIFAEAFNKNIERKFGFDSKRITPVASNNIKLDDIKGCDEVKEEVKEIIEYLKDPQKFTKLGAKLPKGILLSGPPGTGKTMIARAVSGEANVPFYQTSASEFEEVFVGVGAKRIRELFTEARSNAPCIIFIDEIDAIGSRRSNKDNTAVRMTLNQLLVELDGFEQNEGVVVICATNFSELLDSALTRPGRLDKIIVVPLPDLQGRLKILELYASRIQIDKGVDLEILARRTGGMTGADLFNILNTAAMKSAADGNENVSMEYIDNAFDRIVVGLERKSNMSDAEKLLTAYHEGGHTIVSLYTQTSNKVHKATILPRGSALGITWTVPEGDKYSHSLSDLEGRLMVLMGGKVAEEIIYGSDNVTAGCMSDLKDATQIATNMVMNYGMGTPEDFAPIFLSNKSYSQLSGEIKSIVDASIQRLLNNARQKAKNLVMNHVEELHLLANALVEYNTLTREEMALALSGNIGKIEELRKKSEEIKTPNEKP